MKKIMLLGGNYFQMTATKAAKRLGHHVISVDYLPENPAHKYADEYYNISTIDKEAVLKLAQKLQINGIVSYGSDVSAATAAYVAEKMNLPTNPYDTVFTMTRKDLFRKALKKNGIRVPQIADIQTYAEAKDFFVSIGKPVMIKPLTGSGTKGVSKVSSEAELEQAFAEAKKYSVDGNLMMEEFVQRKGYQVAGDAFVVNGKITVFAIANEHFDKLCNPLVPIGESFPACLNETVKDKARNEIEKALQALGIKQGAINLDFMIDENNEVFIIELGPRNGGNLITDAILLNNGVDLGEATIKAALGEDMSYLKERPMEKFVSSYIPHAIEDGIYEEILISDKIRDKIRLQEIFIKPGDPVHSFQNSNFGIGAMLIEFDSKEEMLYALDNMEEFIKVKVKSGI